MRSDSELPLYQRFALFLCTFLQRGVFLEEKKVDDAPPATSNRNVVDTVGSCGGIGYGPNKKKCIGPNRAYVDHS